jgi:hypothetical protein
MRGTRVLATARASLAALALVAGGVTSCPGVALSSTQHPARTDETPFAYDTSGIVGIGAAPSSVIGPAVLQFQGITGASYDPAYGQPISLGQFVMNPSSSTNGTTTFYNGTPFEVQIQAPELNKTSTFPLLDQLFPSLGKSLSLKTLNENSVILKGHLDGTISPNGQASITATVDTVKLGSLDASTSDHITHYTFPIHFSQLKLPSSWVMAGSTVPTGSTLSLTSTPSPTVSTATTTQAIAQPQLIAEPQLIATSATASSPAASIAPAPAAEMSSATTTPIPTPEPSTILVFATAFAGLALARRGRRSAR